MKSRNLETRLKIAKKMIGLLKEHTMQRGDWNIMCQITATKFARMLTFLMDNGYVERVKKGVYRATDKGRAFAETI